jgi:hypothetical protein
MIVLCTGIIRSGSTWSFNVARLLLARRSAAVRGEFSNKIRTAVRSADAGVEHHVIKAHEPDRFGRRLITEGRCRTICTYRDPLECIASGIEAFGGTLEDMVALTRRHMEFLKLQHTAGGVHFVWYDDIVERPNERIRGIADYLGQPIDDAGVREIARSMDRDSVARLVKDLPTPPPDGKSRQQSWDPETLFHPGHIRERPRTAAELLTPSQLRYAVGQLAEFVDASGALRESIKAIGRLPPVARPSAAGATA